MYIYFHLSFAVESHILWAFFQGFIGQDSLKSGEGYHAAKGKRVGPESWAATVRRYPVYMWHMHYKLSN